MLFWVERRIHYSLSVLHSLCQGMHIKSYIHLPQTQVFLFCVGVQVYWSCSARSTHRVQQPSPLAVWADRQQTEKAAGAGRLTESPRAIAGSYHSPERGRQDLVTQNQSVDLEYAFSHWATDTTWSIHYLPVYLYLLTVWANHNVTAGVPWWAGLSSQSPQQHHKSADSSGPDHC